MKIKNVILLLLVFIASSSAQFGYYIEPDKVKKNEDFKIVLYYKGQLSGDKGTMTVDPGKGYTVKGGSWERVNIQEGFFYQRKVWGYVINAKASKTGKISVGPIKWNIQGQIKPLGNIDVKVERGYSAPGIIIYPAVSKKTMFVGEQFRLNLYFEIYDNYQQGFALSDVDFKDFWVHREEITNDDLQIKRNNKKPFMRGSINLDYGYMSPLKSGELEIPSLKMPYTKAGPVKKEETRKKTGNSSFVSSVMRQTTIEDTARTRKVKVNVIPLPAEGKPSNFTGLVGQYRFKANIDKNSLKMGEALTLHITVSGNGRPGAIPQLKLPDFSEFRSVPPETKVTKKVKGGLIHTTKTFKYFLYPRRTGNFKIESIPFNYFDPKTKKYHVLNSDQFTVTVEKGEGVQQTQVFTNSNQGGAVNNQTEVKQLGRDIRYIITDRSQLKRDNQYVFTSAMFWLYFALCFIPLGLVLLVSKMKKGSGDKEKQVKKKKAGAMSKASKFLKQAHASLGGEDSRQFFENIKSGVENFLSDKLNIPFQGLTLDKACKQLQDNGVDAELVQEFKEVLNQCDMFLFTSQNVSKESKEELYKRADQMIKKMGQEL